MVRLFLGIALGRGSLLSDRGRASGLPLLLGELIAERGEGVR